MRMSKLFRLWLFTGSVRKLLPLRLVFGWGKKTARRAARGSIGVFVPPLPVKMFVGLPAGPVPIGVPQRPFAFCAANTFAAAVMVWRVLKISPTNVGLPLQSSAIVL